MDNICEEKILVVDGEYATRTITSQILVGDGYRIETAESGALALELAEERTFALVISDYTLPDMNGVELFLRLRELCPAMKGIILSDDPNLNILSAAISTGIECVLANPANLRELMGVGQSPQ